MPLITHGQLDTPGGEREVGTRFILSIITLMVFMGVLALCSAFFLYNMNAGWSRDVQKTMTIEIPAHLPDGARREAPQMNGIARQVINALGRSDIVDETRLIAQSEVREDLTPWFGQAAYHEDIPIPTLIHVKLNNGDDFDDPALDETVANILPDILIDRHEAWLDDLTRLTGSLGLLALILMGLIVMTVTVAIAGAVRARLSAHADEVDLLHLMGARDRYIATDFRTQIMALTMRGCVVGFLCALGFIVGLNTLSSTLELALSDLPGMSWVQWIGLLLIPLSVLLLSAWTANRTVLLTLEKMP